MSGAKAIQQNALRQIGTGPAIAKGSTCNSAEAIARNNKRGEIERIVDKFSSWRSQKISQGLYGLGECMHPIVRPAAVHK